jgi:hypothetical protein
MAPKVPIRRFLYIGIFRREADSKRCSAIARGTSPYDRIISRASSWTRLFTRTADAHEPLFTTPADGAVYPPVVFFWNLYVGSITSAWICQTPADIGAERTCFRALEMNLMSTKCVFIDYFADFQREVEESDSKSGCNCLLFDSSSLLFQITSSLTL